MNRKILRQLYQAGQIPKETAENHSKFRALMTSVLWAVLMILVILGSFLTLSAAGGIGHPAPPPADRAANSTMAGMIGPEGVDPAALFPQDTLFQLDLNYPSETIDSLSRMEFWPEAVALFAEMAGAAGELGDAQAASFLGEMSRMAGEWNGDGEIRELVRSFAGQRLVAGLFSPDGLEHPVLVAAALGDDPGGAAVSLARLLSRLGRKPFICSDTRTSDPAFHISTATAEEVIVGRRAGQWLIFSGAQGRQTMETLAAHLENGTVPPQTLTETTEYRRTMEVLPSTACCRGFINLPQILNLVREYQQRADCAEYGQLLEFLDDFAAIGVAREVTAGEIRSWISGRVSDQSGENPLAALMRDLKPVKTPLSSYFPAGALVSYDIGASADTVLEAIGGTFAALAPQAHAWAGTLLSRFSEATGLVPADDLFPAFGRGMATAVLPPNPGESWILPRPVHCAVLEDPALAVIFLESWIRWKAGTITEMTGGLVSAMPVTEVHEGVKLMGLQIEGLIPLPLPSPTAAVVEGLLIVTPVRSAAKETISAIHGTIPARHGPAGDRVSGRGFLPEAVETFTMDLKGMERAWSAIEETLTSPSPPSPETGETASSDVSDSGSGREPLIRIGRAWFRVLAAMGQASGSATVSDDGGFLCLMKAGDGLSAVVNDQL